MSPRPDRADRDRHVLWLRLGESVVIGDLADVVVAEIYACYGHNVRLGVEAPREIPVHRREIQELVERERRERLR
jgi:carbon storage regulator